METLDFDQKVSEKKYVTAVIISAIFGVLGFHHFYLGRYKMGMLDLLLTLGGLGLIISGNILLGYAIIVIDVIHTIFVTFALLIGKYKDGKGFIVPYPGQKIN